MERTGGSDSMGRGYLVIGNILVTVDVFSERKDSLRPGEIRILDPTKDLKKQIYEALSGKEWDESMDKLDGLLEESQYGIGKVYPRHS